MKVSEQIISVLNALCEKIGIAVDWTAANVLPYMQDLCGRLVTYSIASNIAAIIFLIIGLIVIGFVFKFCLKKYQSADCYNEGPWAFGGIFSGIIFGGLCITCLIVIPGAIMEIIQAYTIPELTIIEMVEKFIETK